MNDGIKIFIFLYIIYYIHIHHNSTTGFYEAIPIIFLLLIATISIKNGIVSPFGNNTVRAALVSNLPRK